MAHNFGHSFFSFTNYLDGGFVIDLVPEILSKSEDGSLKIDVLRGEIRPDVPIADRLKKSLQHYREWLPKLMKSHSIDQSAIISFILLARATPMGLIISAEVEDDRRKVRRVRIY